MVAIIALCTGGDNDVLDIAMVYIATDIYVIQYLYNIYMMIFLLVT